MGIFGEEFKSGITAFRLLCIGNLFNSLSGSVGYFMQMTGSQYAFQNIVIFTTIIGILLNLYLIPKFGINGAAVSTGAGLIFWNLFCVIYTKQKYDIKTYYLPFFK